MPHPTVARWPGPAGWPETLASLTLPGRWQADVELLQRGLCGAGQDAGHAPEPTWSSECVLQRWSLQLRGAQGRLWRLGGVGSPAELRRALAELTAWWGQLGTTSSRERRRASWPEGEPIWWAPEAAGVWLHEVVGHLLEADVAGFAPGETIAGPWCDLWEAGGSGFDDEGVPIGAQQLVRAGTVRARVSDRWWARLSDGAASGRGRSESALHPVLPRLRALELRAAGSADTVGSCLRVLSVEEAEVEPASGRFWCRVQRAESAAGTPLRPFVIRGEVRQALHAVRAVGRGSAVHRGICRKAGQEVGVQTTSPGLLVAGLTCLPESAWGR